MQTITHDLSAIHAEPVTPDPRDALVELGREYHRRGWSLGTSSNYSVVVGRDPLRLLITSSGRDKGALSRDDFVTVDAAGTVVVANGAARPSAETLLHATLADVTGAGAMLHTHSVAATVLSDLHCDSGRVRLAGWEMLKGLDGITTHDTGVEIEIFQNTQNMADLADRVRGRLLDERRPLRHGFLLSGHGLYTWGTGLAEARRHVEVLEFLFEVELRRTSVVGTAV